uniref:Secreted protein n=1 Tax=Steinernema glaseri TaxID=37863 RepID=A0A1I7ZKH5_9BILA
MPLLSSNMRGDRLSQIFVVAIIFAIITQPSAGTSLSDLYNKLQMKALSSSVMRDDPVPLANGLEPSLRSLSPHLKNLRGNYKLPIHGLDVVTNPPVTSQDVKPSQYAVAHIINRLSTVLLRI